MTTCCLVACLTGCAVTPAPAPNTSATTRAASAAPPLGPFGAAGCVPASPIRIAGASGFPEVQATPSGGTGAYGLVMTDDAVPLRASRSVVKVVWRITGEGSLRVGLTDPSGRAVPLVWGPEAHGGSTYTRPGQEWGTGFRVTSIGCWRIRLERGSGRADVWFDVGPARTSAPSASAVG